MSKENYEGVRILLQGIACGLGFMALGIVIANGAFSPMRLYLLLVTSISFLLLTALWKEIALYYEWIPDKSQRQLDKAKSIRYRSIVNER